MTARKPDALTARVRWTAVAQRVVDYCGKQAKKTSDLSLTQSRILFHLAVYPGKCVSDIARSLNLRITTTASAIDAICAIGYVTKSPSNVKGKRGVQVFLTQEGYAQLPRYIAGFERVFGHFAGLIGEEELENMLQTLLPDGTISMVENCCDDTTLQPHDIYERLRVPEESDPDSALFDKAMYIEKVAWSLEEIDRRDELGATRKERLIMRALADLGGSAEVRDLRRLLFIKPAAASGTLKTLQDKGYVSRVDNPDNRRVVIASLTEAGAQAESSTRAGYEAVFDECFPGFAQLD